jgi:hypothetical protein
MTAVAIETRRLYITADLVQEILARVDRGGLQICEAELRYQLCWNEDTDGPLLEILDDLEHRGLIESAVHFRLTNQGQAELPEDYEPPIRYGHPGIPWSVKR